MLMTTTRRNWCKRGLSLLLAAVLLLSLGAVSVFAAGKTALSEPGTYSVPITSLVSKAPLAPVQKAFAKAFGDSAQITVDTSGNWTATLTNYHMTVDMGIAYGANVLTVEGATILGTRMDTYSPGMVPTQTAIEVPTAFSLPLEKTDDGVYALTITVDFMNALLGGGDSYPTGVTMTLDLANASADTSELTKLIAEYRTISKDNYTAESWANFEAALTKAEKLAGGSASMTEINAMIAELEAAHGQLAYQGADYSKVDAALEKIPADGSLYTEASWSALQAAKDAVVNGKSAAEQNTVDGWAADIEAALAALEYQDADYTKVDEAIAAVPSDLTKYTEESVKNVQDAVNAVERGLKADAQATVDQMAERIHAAVQALEEKGAAEEPDQQKPSDTTLDKDHLQDGIYEVAVSLWHATNNQASMAAESLRATARIVVKNGVATMYIYTREMTFGNITASLQELKVADLQGNYSNATVQSKDASGNPTSFSFVLPHTQEYIVVKVNPYVEMMGNQDLDARIRVDYSTLKQVSENASDPAVNLTAPASGASSTPKTGDSNVAAVLAVVLLLSAGAFAATTVCRKKVSEE